jgi:uncharacterized membrane protein YhaH (DUF805 family)
MPVNDFLAFAFSKRLQRLSYFVRIFVVDVMFWLLVQWKRSLTLPLTDVQLWEFITPCIFLAVYSTLFAIAPRLRDAGSSVWLAILGLAPFVWPLVHVIVGLLPPKRDVAPQET